MKRVLIADPNEVLGNIVRRRLKDEYEILLCKNGQDLSRLIREFDPDVLVIDIVLPDMSALTILQALYSSGTAAKVIAILRGADEFALCQMERLDVRRVITIPCTAEALIHEIRGATDGNQDVDYWCEENEIDRILQVLSFRMGPSRYRCVFEAILFRYENPDCTMKELYIDVAKCCGGNHQRVEKAIRNAIEDAYACGNKEIWDCYFVTDVRREKPYPSNEDFIARIACCLTQRQRIKRKYACDVAVAE